MIVTLQYNYNIITSLRFDRNITLWYSSNIMLLLQRYHMIVTLAPML